MTFGFLQTCQRIGEAGVCIDFEKDLRRIVESRQKAISQPEQTLFETFVSVLLASVKCHYSLYWLTIRIGLDGG